MNKYRIVRYCDDVQYAIEELVKGDWQYLAVYRPREPNMLDVRDMTFDTVDEARRAVERRIAKDQSRIIEAY